MLKLIKSGGTTGRSGRKGRLACILRDDKLARVIHPTGRLEPDARPKGTQVDRLTRAWSRSWWADMRGGNTSHMILSYPKGVPVDRVDAIPGTSARRCWRTARGASTTWRRSTWIPTTIRIRLRTSRPRLTARGP